MKRFLFGGWLALVAAAACSNDYTLDSPASPLDAGIDAQTLAQPSDDAMTTTANEGQAGPDADTDAGDDDAAGETPDAAVAIPIDAGPCDLTKPFGERTKVLGLQGDSFIYGTLTPDELTIYLQGPGTNPKSHSAIYIATRATRADAFATPTPFTPANSSDPNVDTFDQALSRDGKTLYFREDVNAADGGLLTTTIYKTTNDPQNGWSSPVAIEDGDTILGLAVAPSGTIYTGRYQDETTEFDLAFQRPTAAKYSLITALNSPGYDAFPVVSPDELTLFFGSNRAGADPNGFETMDIYVVKRATASDDFSQAALVPELNTDFYETPDWISADGCRMYFTAARNATDELLREFVAERPH